MPKTKTHFQQVPVKTVEKKILEEENDRIGDETPEQLRGPTEKTAGGNSSAEVKPHGEKGNLG